MSALFRRARTRLRKLRQDRGWTQEELAERAGVTKTDVCRMEVGTNEDMKLSTLERFARVFRVKAEELIKA